MWWKSVTWITLVVTVKIQINRDQIQNPQLITAAETLTRNYMYIKSRDSSVGIQMGYELNGRGSIPGRGKWFLSSPHLVDRLSSPSLPIQLVLGVKWPGVKLTTHLLLVTRSKVMLYVHYLITLHGMQWLGYGLLDCDAAKCGRSYKSFEQTKVPCAADSCILNTKVAGFCET
jgi:hypothetical protein